MGAMNEGKYGMAVLFHAVGIHGLLRCARNDNAQVHVSKLPYWRTLK
jgi:hypothetical protein